MKELLQIIFFATPVILTVYWIIKISKSKPKQTFLCHKRQLHIDGSNCKEQCNNCKQRYK